MRNLFEQLKEIRGYSTMIDGHISTHFLSSLNEHVLTEVESGKEGALDLVVMELYYHNTSMEFTCQELIDAEYKEDSESWLVNGVKLEFFETSKINFK